MTEAWQLARSCDPGIRGRGVCGLGMLFLSVMRCPQTVQAAVEAALIRPRGNCFIWRSVCSAGSDAYARGDGNALRAFSLKGARFLMSAPPAGGHISCLFWGEGCARQAPTDILVCHPTSPPPAPAPPTAGPAAFPGRAKSRKESVGAKSADGYRSSGCEHSHRENRGAGGWFSLRARRPRRHAADSIMLCPVFAPDGLAINPSLWHICHAACFCSSLRRIAHFLHNPVGLGRMAMKNIPAGLAADVVFPRRRVPV